ncbi:hypothetical protein WA026_020282 [Henosepilachna vigintioctopunctata]
MDDPSHDGPLFSTDHEIMKNIQNLTKVKKKRGRPKKQPSDKELMENVTEQENKEVKDQENNSCNTDDVVSDGKRRRKIPARFFETIQGKELDDMLRKEGIEEEINMEQSELRIKEAEIIGRIECQSGEEQTKPVIVIKKFKTPSNKEDDISIIRRKRRRKYKCDQCFKEFKNYSRLRVHKGNSHKNGIETENSNTKNVEDETKCVKEDRVQMKDESLVENSESSSTVNSKNDATSENTETSNNENVQEAENEDAEKFLVCKQCDKTFTSKQNLKVHMEAVHEKLRSFSCLDCKQTFSYAKSFRMHQLKHKRGIFTCEVCQKKFNHPSSLGYHRSAEHNNGRRFVCNKCDKTFKHPQLLHRHQLVHSEERPFKCDMCNAAFKTRTNLRSHKAVHTGERRYACAECGQTFAHKTSLKLHTRWHLGEKPFGCEICKKKFSQKGNLLEHQRIHTGEKPFCCDQCGRNFTTSSQLKLHKKRHTGERPFKCDLCPKSFLHKESWKEHSRRHIISECPYKCQICSKSFTVLHYLKRHMRLHSGEKPYSCNICWKDFSDSSNLNKHRAIHEQKFSDENHTPLSIPNTSADNNLIYVYLETPKDQSVPETIVELEQPQSEIVVSSEQNLDSFKEESMQYQQLVDQEGNPLSLNTQDGQQINVVTSITNGQEKLQGLLPDGTLVAIDLQDFKIDNMEFQRLVDNVEEETSVSHLLLDGGMTFLNDSIIKQAPDLLVTEQPNLCFVTYDPTTGNIIQ